MIGAVKTTLKTIVVLLGLFLLFFAVMAVKFSPGYIYRLVRFNVADVYDYTHFENRMIRPSESACSFARSPDEQYVESLFHNEVKKYGCENLQTWAELSQTTALILIRRDTILYENYFNGFSRDSYFHSQSMAKSFISSLIGFAIEDGYIKSVEDPMTDYIPELLGRDKDFGKISIENLLSMQSGLKYRESFIPVVGIHAPWHDEALGYYHGNVRKLLLRKVKPGEEPGRRFQYNNYNTSYLGLIIERSTGKTVSAYMEEKLWSRIMEYDALFSIDSKRSGFEYMPSRLIARAIDYARFGRLFLNAGNWEGEQLLPEDWVRMATLEDKEKPREHYPGWMGSGCYRTYYGYQWWGHVNCDSTINYFASGNLGQDIYIIPEKETIIVHCGNSLQHYNPDMLRKVAEKMK